MARIDRHASGTYEACRDKMDEIRTRDKLPPMEGKAIVVLHGLFRTRSSMATLGGALSKSGGYKTFCVGYPTTRGSVESHARSLDNVIRSLEGISEINFVAHSLGNLVVRHWLNDFAAAERTLPKGQTFGRMVMLAPPNRQPKLATILIRGSVANFVAGPAAEAMATGWEKLGAEAGDAALRVRRAGRRQRRRQGIQSAAAGRRRRRRHGRKHAAAGGSRFSRCCRCCTASS